MRYQRLYIKYVRSGGLGCGYRNCFVKDSEGAFASVYYPPSNDFAVVDIETVVDAKEVDDLLPHQMRALLEQVETRQSSAGLDGFQQEMLSEVVAYLRNALHSADKPKTRVRVRGGDRKPSVRVRTRVRSGGSDSQVSRTRVRKRVRP